jgi:hypothetical protein
MNRETKRSHFVDGPKYRQVHMKEHTFEWMMLSRHDGCYALASQKRQTRNVREKDQLDGTENCCHESTGTFDSATAVERVNKIS